MIANITSTLIDPLYERIDAIMLKLFKGCAWIIIIIFVLMVLNGFALIAMSATT